MKKIYILILLCLIALAPCIASAESITWTIDDNGTLTISGTGAMPDFDIDEVPWGSSAQFSMSDIKNVIINDGVTSIAKYAFLGGKGIESISVPASVIRIYESFSNCPSLESINVDSANEKYTSIDGLLFNKDITTLIAYPAGKADAEYSVPDTVTTIGSGAFSGCTSLAKINIPESVTDIGAGAFLECSSLFEINVASDNTGYTSRDGVLFNKDMSRLIIYPTCKKGEYTIPGTVKDIESYAFKDCRFLTGVTIPEGVAEIKLGTFNGCSELTSVNLPNSITKFDLYAFANCTALKSITLPESTEKIYPLAFAWCTSLTEFVIPESVTYIEQNMLSCCSALKSISVAADNPEFASQDGVLFSKDMTKLIIYPEGKENVSYIVPESVTEMEFSAFGYADTALSSLVIQDSIVNLPYTFGYNDTLSDIYYTGTEADWNTKVEPWRNPLKDSDIAVHYDYEITDATALALTDEGTYTFTTHVSDIGEGTRLVVLLFNGSELTGAKAVPLTIGESSPIVTIKADSADGAKVFLWSGSSLDTAYEISL